MPTESPFNSECFAKKFAGANAPASILSVMILLVPALGVPSVLMVQDTLKSAIVAFATLICALVFFWQQRQNKTPLLWHGLLWLPLLLMLYALGSIYWSHSYLASVETIRWFIFTLLLWLGLNSFTPKNIPLLVWAIHIGAVIASIWAALQFWCGLSLFPQFAAPASTFINHNFFAEYIICTLPFSLWALTSMRASPWLGIVSFSIALNLVALMMTGCRAAMIAALVIIPPLLLILWKYRLQLEFIKWKKTQQILVVLILIGGFFAMGSISGNGDHGKRVTPLEISHQRTASVATSKEYQKGSSFSVRARMWQATFAMIKAEPLTGVGAGSWEVQIPRYQSSTDMSELDYFTHNEYLQLLSEYGLIIGGVFLIILLLYLLTTFYQTWQLQGEDLQAAPLRAFTLTSLLAFFTISGAGFPWHLTSTVTLFAICLALLARSDAQLNNQTITAKKLAFTRQLFSARHLPWSPTLSKIILLLLACALLLAGYITRQAATVEYKIIKSIQLGEIAQKLRKAGQNPSAEHKALVIKNMRDANAITPHYRKLVDPVIGHLIKSNDWTNALWLSESLAASRPYVPMLWFRVANLNNKLGQYDEALRAVKIALELQAVMPGMRALEIDLLSQTGKEAEATQLVTRYLDSGAYDYLLAQSAYRLAVKTSDWPLAIRALTLRNQIWPAEMADGNLKLGEIYINLNHETKALEAFRAAVNAASEQERDNFRSKVPEPYRSRL